MCGWSPRRGGAVPDWPQDTAGTLGPLCAQAQGGCGGAGPWTRWLSLAVPDASRAGRFAHMPRDNTYQRSPLALPNPGPQPAPGEPGPEPSVRPLLPSCPAPQKRGSLAGCRPLPGPHTASPRAHGPALPPAGSSAHPAEPGASRTRGQGPRSNAQASRGRASSPGAGPSRAHTAVPRPQPATHGPALGSPPLPPHVLSAQEGLSPGERGKGP